MRFAGLHLQSSVCRSAPSTAPQSSVGSPCSSRTKLQHIVGNVGAIMFDFDGTLTATPGDRTERKFKIAELKERAPLLEPWLARIRDANITMGIISKSSENTISRALDQAGLRHFIDGPLIAKAVGLEGKAGFIDDLCTEGGLSHLGPQGLTRVLLVDDDVLELERAAERGIQTYPAPFEGGLLDENFHDILEAIGVECPPRPEESKEVLRIWTWGMTAEHLGLSKEESTIAYTPGSGPLVTDFWSIDDSACTGITAGTFGEIKPGTHLLSNMRCACKIMRKDVVGRHYLETFVENDGWTFLLKMARDEPHPNVLRQLDYLMGEKTIYNGMELLEGLDLFTFLSEYAPITEGVAQGIVLQLLAALAHIHQASGVGLIHRDVKLENLRFRSLNVKSDLVLVDFGLSCFATPLHAKRGIMGTTLYMAPEIYSQRYSSKVDLWASGVLLFIILTGKPPWPVDPADGVCLSEDIGSGQAVEEALSSNELASSPVAAVDLLKGLLVVDPEKRLSAPKASEQAWFAHLGRSSEVKWDDEATELINVPTGSYATTQHHIAETPKARIGFTSFALSDLPDEDALEEGGSPSRDVEPPSPVPE